MNSGVRINCTLVVSVIIRVIQSLVLIMNLIRRMKDERSLVTADFDEFIPFL